MAEGYRGVGRAVYTAATYLCSARPISAKFPGKWLGVTRNEPDYNMDTWSEPSAIPGYSRVDMSAASWVDPVNHTNKGEDRSSLFSLKKDITFPSAQGNWGTIRGIACFNSSSSTSRDACIWMSPVDPEVSVLTGYILFFEGSTGWNEGHIKLQTFLADPYI